MTFNPLTYIDGYKLDHRRQYPARTTRVYSNLTARGSRVPGVESVVFVGLQYFLQRYLMEEMRAFFSADPDEVCARYADRVNGYLGPNAIGTDHIRALHRLGYVPLVFRAFPEGTAVPLRQPMLTVENTHPDFAWLVNYYETLLSACLWLPCTSATTATRFRGLLDRFAIRTGASREFVDWQGHDFSMRGMGGPEAAALSGLGHLVAFTGTDTIPALDLVDDYYPMQGLVGGSVAATEHSVMCAGGEEGEAETFARLIALYPSGILSVVSDTWDLWHVLTETVPSLKASIMGRDGKLVIRPDSGDPVKILCGDPDATGPAKRGVVGLLYDTFGGTTNTAGFLELDSHVGCIYGDSINYERAEAILTQLEAQGFASSNVVFGIGSFTYQYVTRDTFNFAMKATWVEVAGEGRAISKAPKTDDGLKFSARGRLAIIGGQLVQDATPEQEATSALTEVWRDGVFTRYDGLDAVRFRAR